MAVAQGEWTAAWEQALAALELDVDLAERMLTFGHLAEHPGTDPWTAPSLIGPIPLDLVGRARLLLERQLDVGRRLAEAASLSRRHLRATDAMRSVGPAVPVYLDTPA